MNLAKHSDLDREVERMILGSLMTEPSLIPVISPKISSSAFFTKDHQIIYDGILQSFEKSNHADPIVVSSTIEKEGNINRVGGHIYLYDLVTGIVETESAEYYADILREKWVKRKLMAVGENLKTTVMENEGKEDSKDIGTILDELQSEIFSLNLDLMEKEDTAINASLAEVLTEIVNPTKSIGIFTGFLNLDIVCNGFQNGDLIIFAARPSMGKSALLTNILHNISMYLKTPTLLFSLEMPKSQIILRLLSNETDISYSDLRRGEVDDWDNIVQSMTRLKYMPFHIIDKRGLPINTIKAEARRLKNEIPDLGVIAVDYVQLVQSSRRYASREQEVADVTRNLKALAGELDIPIILCSQINRQHETNGDKRPQLSSMRESGELEQTADLIAFLYREDYYDENSENEGLCELIVRKNRNGPTGTVMLEFEKETMSFSDAF